MTWTALHSVPDASPGSGGLLMKLPRSLLTGFRRRSKRYREAKLRPEFARLYPALPANQWHPAAAVRCVVVNQSRYGYPRRPLPPRALDEEHFLFRGISSTERPAGEDRRLPVPSTAYGGREAWWEGDGSADSKNQPS
jgi:hypothetical protein